MNIALLTFSRAFSYGAMLQCYSLSKILMDAGHRVFLLRSDLKAERGWRYHLNSLTRCSNFRKFRKSFLPPVLKDQYKDLIDLYIVGSDQVWNPHIAIRPLDYFFEFLPSKVKRISYAASFGTKIWNCSFLTEQVTTCLKKFNAISVRENSGIDICQNVFHVASECVLDPTLLLSDYSHLTITSTCYQNSLFYYRVSYRSDWGDFASYIGMRLKLKVKGFDGKKQISFLPLLGGINYEYPSIGTWLGAIVDSAFVVTDSFHTVVFAILNRKPFLVLPSVEELMERIISLLSLLEITDRYYSSVEEVKNTDAWLFPIDYNAVHLKLHSLRQESLRFLFSHLK